MQPDVPDDAIIGPCQIDCREKCEFPAGLVAVEVPRPRHAWGDVLCCPHCDKAFLILKRPGGRDD